jgi:hypothetical protein
VTFWSEDAGAGQHRTEGEPRPASWDRIAGANRNTSSNFMHDIKVAARLEGLATIGNVQKRPLDGLLTRKCGV